MEQWKSALERAACTECPQGKYRILALEKHLLQVGYGSRICLNLRNSSQNRRNRLCSSQDNKQATTSRKNDSHSEGYFVKSSQVPEKPSPAPPSFF
ncbi:hypothetical protein GWI33_017005 [Rhynchophorus ferrugineus]|uniref:Uncharacterized protein n=1 Tax=Rhynchophorus ferrugineus TaxID=354439 RepID=A0A834I2Q4_RHYFE|nr:hypothetical protein GWI33_017005 [Rhynchophorus ferrugineus]